MRGWRLCCLHKVEALTHDLSRGSIYGTDAAEADEGGLAPSLSGLSPTVNMSVAA